MSYEHVWAVIGILMLSAWAGLAIWSRHLRDAKRVAMREMVHRERLAALEKDQPLPEVPAEAASSVEQGGDAGAWVSRVSLLAGLALTFAGIGLLVSFTLTPNRPETAGLGDLASMGFLPIFTGVGLLLFYFLDRRGRRLGP
jgi:hypothetical protein